MISVEEKSSEKPSNILEIVEKNYPRITGTTRNILTKWHKHKRKSTEKTLHAKDR